MTLGRRRSHVSQERKIKRSTLGWYPLRRGSAADMTLFFPAPLLARSDFKGDFLASGTLLGRSDNGHDAQVKGVAAEIMDAFERQEIPFSGMGW